MVNREMNTALYLIACYGLCFGLQNKAPWLSGRTIFTDRMLACSYCTGFHCGWVVWLFSYVVGIQSTSIYEAVVWAFASGAFCYTTDSAVKWLETHTPA